MTRRWRNVLSPCHIVGDDRQIAPLTVVTSVELYLAEIIRPLFKGYRRLAVGDGCIRDLLRALSQSLTGSMQGA
jgi:hypothetical protein